MQATDFERAAHRPRWLALLLAVLMALVSACGDGSAPVPTIGMQPSDTSAAAGTAATFSVSATGADISYLWQVSTDGGTTWINVAGATQASYTTPLTTLADSGKRYRVVVSSAGISVNSSAVQLTVTPAVVAPALTVQPAAQTSTAPDPATFSVTASGTSPTYQWQRSTDGGTTYIKIAGATAATYSIGATTTTMSGERYRVVVTNSAGAVTSSAVVLTVNPTPLAAAFTTQPANQSVTAGNAAAFSVVATGTPAPTLQWQRSTDGGSTFTNIAGATDPTFNTGLTIVSQNGERYRAVASNGAGSATSNAATLTVNPASQAPVITTQPTAQTVIAPATATFTAAATGVPTPTWQWQLSSDGGATFANINGATGTDYTTPATAIGDSGKRYRAVATNSAGSATTSASTLTVNSVFLPTYQFNLFGFNAGPSSFVLYGGHVTDSAGNIQCSGYTALADPCPKWRADYRSGTLLTLTATPWPGWRVRSWIGGDCGSPGSDANVTLTIDHNSNCSPQFELIPGSTFSVSAVPAGAWIGLVVEMVADRFGNLVVSDTPMISCGPLAATQICDANVAVGASPYIVMRLRALPLGSAPVGQVRWTCASASPDDGTIIVRTVMGADIDFGPIYGNTACSAELIPTP